MTRSKTLFCALALSVIAAPAWSYDNYIEALEVQQEGKISYVNGGVGDEEMAALQSMQHSYNLRIMNVDKTGHYLDNVHITLRDQQNNILLETTGGPLFFIKVPNGRYTVDATYNGVVKNQTANVVKGKPAQMSLSWSQ